MKDSEPPNQMQVRNSGQDIVSDVSANVEDVGSDIGHSFTPGGLGVVQYVGDGRRWI